VLVALRLDGRRAPRLFHPRAQVIAAGARGWVARTWWLPQALLLLALALTAVALARPQADRREPERRSVEGIDIVIALDLSTSMRAADFEPESRIHVAKEVLKDFIGRRRTDRIGLVVFAGDAYTQAPLTLDYAMLRSLVDQLKIGVIEDGTAIGNALATAVNRLRESDARSKVVILITDGDNNRGQVSPRAAAEMAHAMGVRVFPILVGKGGVVPYPDGVDLLGRPSYRPVKLDVNPELLREIAEITGGASVTATDRKELEGGLQAVLDRMEKTRIIEATAGSQVAELFPRALLPAFLLAALGLVLGLTRWRAFP
jgi:Ca-activated chloride channel family protein